MGINVLTRSDAIQALKEDKLYYVQAGSQGFVGNALCWWGVNGRGYTWAITKAHKYSKQDIIEGNWRDSDIIWPCSHVDNATMLIVDAQQLDQEFAV